MTIYNPITNDVFEYELQGIGEDPLSEGHINLHCFARKQTSHTFMINNYTEKPVTYEVSTDLYNASGDSTLIIPPKSSSHYTLSVAPTLSGEYTGSITFTDVETKEFLWWTITLDTASPKCE